ncbi:energy transducer TonB [Paraburkholderia sp.]|uniref:energy transducer TonB n=1 Tax=Paraburkholderia sp. TaxID=1926495 RepID=UPI00397BCBF5
MSSGLQRVLSLADRERVRFALALALAGVVCLGLLAHSVGWLTSRESAPPVPKPMEMQLVELAPVVPPAAPPTAPTAPTPPAPATPVMHAAAGPAATRPTSRQAPLTHAVPPPRAPAPQPHEATQAPAPEPAAHNPPAAPSTPAPAAVAQAASSTSAPSSGANSSAPPAPSGSSQARAISQPVPVLPDDLREQGYQVTAVAHFKVHADGTFEVELVKPTQNPRLNQILLETLHRWRFFPAMENGRPVESDQEVRVHFSVS